MREVDRRGRELAGSEDWERFRSDASAAGCQFLADLANALQGLRGLTKRGVEAATARVFGDNWPVERRIAAECVIRMIDLNLGGAAELVTALRVLGIFSCVMSDRPISTCPCLADWWDAEGKAATKTALGAALPITG